MFKQAKKARELMGEQSYTHDEFNWIQIILTVIFSIAIVGIWYYSKKANISIENKLNTDNPIIKDIQADDNLDDVMNDYGNIYYDNEK